MFDITDMYTQEEMGRRLKAEFAPASPKIRLTLISMLLEFCKPDPRDPGDIRGLLDMLHEFVIEEYTAFSQLVDEVYVDDIIDKEEDEPYDNNEDGYL